MTNWAPTIYFKHSFCLCYAFELYVYLAIGQPDDKGNEDCLVLVVMNVTGIYRLNDAPCSHTAKGYICEQHSMSLLKTTLI